MKKILYAALFLLLAAPLARAAEDAPAPKTKILAPEFAVIKGWAGKWEGEVVEGAQRKDVKVEYRVTSGGMAVEEILFAGSDHEMISVYYPTPDGKIGMTHYCVLGNRPNLEMNESEKGRMNFTFVPGNGVDAEEPHMHNLRISIKDSDNLIERWTGSAGGELQPDTVITLKRVAS